MKTRIAFALCLGVCSLSVLLPLGIFYIQDSVAVDKDIVWQSSTEDIAKNYPVVSRVYANFYQGNETMMDNESFHLSDMSAYTEKQQSQLTEVKKKYSRELNQLLAQGIFPYELLDLKKGEPFSVEFGTLSQMSEKSGAWQLNQVYRLNTANDNIGIHHATAYTVLISDTPPLRDSVFFLEVLTTFLYVRSLTKWKAL